MGLAIALVLAGGYLVFSSFLGARRDRRLREMDLSGRQRMVIEDRSEEIQRLFNRGTRAASLKWLDDHWLLCMLVGFGLLGVGVIGLLVG